MKVKYFYRSFITDLRLDEYHALVDESIDYVEGQDLEESYVLRVINNVKRHQKPLNLIVERRRFHDDSTAIQDLADERHKKLRSIVDVSRAMLDADTAERREAAAVIASFARKERRALSRKRIKIQNALVSRLTTEADEDERLLEALTTLGLHGIFEEVVLLTMEITELTEKRRVEKNDLSTLAENLRRKSYNDLVILFDTLENHAGIAGEDQNFYQGLCKNLKSILTEHRSVYLLRTAQTEEETDVEVDTETDVEPETGDDSIEEES